MNTVFKAFLLFLALTASTYAQGVKVGDSEAEVLTSTPGYVGAISRSNSKVLYFKNGEITIVDGKVAKIYWKQPKKKTTELPGLVKDPALDMAIRYAIQKTAGSLNEKDLSATRKLEITPKTKQHLKARNLMGLEKATNLVTLKATFNNLTNILSLKGLNRLQSLHLDGRQDGNGTKGSLNSFKPIGTLTYLGQLYLSHYPVTNTVDLDGLRYLRRLTLRECEIADISTLAGFKGSLTEADLSGNRIEDISALGGLTKLTRLSLNNNRIADVSALAKLTNLRELRLDNNAVTDVSALAKLPNLETLSLAGNDVKNLDALRDFAALKSLDLDGNPITDITKLTGILSLRWLSVQDTDLDIAADSDQRGMVMGLRGRKITVRFPEPPKEETEDKPADDKKEAAKEGEDSGNDDAPKPDAK